MTASIEAAAVQQQVFGQGPLTTLAQILLNRFLLAEPLKNPILTGSSGTS